MLIIFNGKKGHPTLFGKWIAFWKLSR